MILKNTRVPLRKDFTDFTWLLWFVTNRMKSSLKNNFLFDCHLLPRPKRILLLKEEGEKATFLFFEKKLLWGQGWVVTFYLRFRLRTYFLNFLQPSSWNNTDRRKWWEGWPLQMEVGIILGMLVVNRSKIHSCLVKPHHASTGGVEDPI